MMQALRVLALLVVCSLAACSKKESSQPATDPAQQPSAKPAAAAAMQRFMVELDPKSPMVTGDSKVRAHESFASADKTYAVFEAESAESLQVYLSSAGVTSRKTIPVRDINSPMRGGGTAAQPQPRTGHKTFVIERKIPGVGTFPDEKKQGIAKKSNAAVAEIGEAIEWDHSYLTDEGTYCVYRATDPEMIQKHASITGAPVNQISEVQVTPAP